jgi:hypothetical protein
MDRRAFLSTSWGVGLGLSAVGCAMPWLDRHGAVGDPHAAALVVVDSTLRASREYAAVATEEGVRRVELDLDVGALWHGRLRDWPGSVRGVLRPSDCFVLRCFALADARAFRSVTIGAGAVAFGVGAIGGRRS